MEEKTVWKQIPEMGSPAGEVHTISELWQKCSSVMLRTVTFWPQGSGRRANCDFEYTGMTAKSQGILCLKQTMQKFSKREAETWSKQMTLLYKNCKEFCSLKLERWFLAEQMIL